MTLHELAPTPAGLRPGSACGSWQASPFGFDCDWIGSLSIDPHNLIVCATATTGSGNTIVFGLVHSDDGAQFALAAAARVDVVKYARTLHEDGTQKAFEAKARTFRSAHLLHWDAEASTAQVAIELFGSHADILHADGNDDLVDGGVVTCNVRLEPKNVHDGGLSQGCSWHEQEVRWVGAGRDLRVAVLGSQTVLAVRRTSDPTTPVPQPLNMFERRKQGDWSRKAIASLSVPQTYRLSLGTTGDVHVAAIVSVDDRSALLRWQWSPGKPAEWQATASEELRGDGSSMHLIADPVSRDAVWQVAADGSSLRMTR